jgi:hypothetical protein
MINLHIRLLNLMAAADVSELAKGDEGNGSVFLNIVAILSGVLVAILIVTLIDTVYCRNAETNLNEELLEKTDTSCKP